MIDLPRLAHELADEIAKHLLSREITSADFVQLRTRVHNLLLESGKEAYLKAFQEVPVRFPLLGSSHEAYRSKLVEAYHRALQKYEGLLQGLARDTAVIRSPRIPDRLRRKWGRTAEPLPLDIHTYSRKNTYIFFCDVVNYSATHIQDQIKTIQQLYEILLEAEVVRSALPSEILAIPTGDGGAIVFIGNADSQAPLRLAIQVHEAIARRSLRFQIRIGIHCGGNYVVVSRTGRRNVIGANMNTAARIMDLAEPMQILSSAEYFNLYVRKDREFERFATPCGVRHVKHGDRVTIYSYHAEGRFGIAAARPAEEPGSHE
jgi:class 3 adenylate cyclase